MLSQYYTEVSIPQNRKKSRKIVGKTGFYGLEKWGWLCWRRAAPLQREWRMPIAAEGGAVSTWTGLSILAQHAAPLQRGRCAGEERAMQQMRTKRGGSGVSDEMRGRWRWKQESTTTVETGGTVGGKSGTLVSGIWGLQAPAVGLQRKRQSACVLRAWLCI